MAGEGLVDRVVDDLVHEVMQTRHTGRADVHRRPLADRLEAFEDFDLVGAIVVDAVNLSRRWVCDLPGRLEIGSSGVLRFGLFHACPWVSQIRIGMITYV